MNHERIPYREEIWRDKTLSELNPKMTPTVFQVEGYQQEYYIRDVKFPTCFYTGQMYILYQTIHMGKRSLNIKEDTMHQFLDYHTLKIVDEIWF